MLARIIVDDEAVACRETVAAAEGAALEAAGGPVPAGLPAEHEFPDPDCGPPDGPDGWLALLPAPLLEEYCDAVAGPAVPEVFRAGLWDRRSGTGAGFASGGAADRLPPGVTLAGMAGDAWAAGLGRLTDDELIGVLLAARRLASWSAALELSAVSDLVHRRRVQEAAGQTGVAEHASDEIAAALTLTARAADRLTDLAVGLDRLPATRAALASGDIDLPRATVICDEVSGLTGQHAAAVERAIINAAPTQTTGQLRAATRRAVTAADPDAARTRKERARREARVERWDEPAGTAALAGRDLPPAHVLAADHHLTALARELQAAGAPGTIDNLRAHVYLALLTGQNPAAPPPAPTGDSPCQRPSAGGSPAPGPCGAPPAAFAGQPQGTRHDGPGPAWTEPTATDPSETGPAGTGLTRTGLTGTVNLTMPATTWLGLSQAPGDAAGYGPLDAADSRTLAAILDQDPRTRWCLTLTDSHGHPIAHGCARTGPPPLSQPVPGPGATAWLASIRVGTLETGECTHGRESRAYRPPPLLQHLIRTRQRTCSFPGCRRPADRCDLDHTIPWDRGGRTCECDLAPLCRRHHRAKQTHGWSLEQPQPGVLVWTLPSGRSYRVGPVRYPGDSPVP